MKLPKINKHDLVAAAVIFAVAFGTALYKGGSFSQKAVGIAAIAALGAVVHTLFGKGA